MDACITNAKANIGRLKKAALKSVKDFMDSCTQMSNTPNDLNQQPLSRTKKEEKEYTEPSNSYHW